MDPRRALFVGVLSVAAVGCGPPPTPAGATVVDADATKYIPEDIRPRVTAAKAALHQKTVKFAHADGETPAAVQVSADAVQDPEGGGLYLTRVVITVKEHGGCVLTQTGVGMPVNRGTVEKPVMSVGYRVTCTRTAVAGRTSHTVNIDVAADGQIKGP